jgi:phosphatidylserine/phosphatidylglycerophosphate/cardiolipin synthase-like enzyme
VLDWYANEVAGKADEALFMTFAFGMDKRFKDIYRRKDRILRMALMDKFGSPATIKRDTKEIGEIRRLPNVLIAVGNFIPTNKFDHWLKERQGMGVKWVHTKFMLVDPLSDDPVVVAGSANFSEPSTDTNNENMLVIRGDTRVADVYFGEYLRLWSHYAFREAVARADASGEDFKPQNLAPDASWQAGYFKRGDGRCARRLYFARS